MRRFLIVPLALLVSTMLSASLAACRQVPEGGAVLAQVTVTPEVTAALPPTAQPPTKTPTPTPTETPTPTPDPYANTKSLISPPSPKKSRTP